MPQEMRHILNISCTQFTWFPAPSAIEWACEWLSEKISIAGNNMIHCTVIRDSVRWKERICSLTRVTHRETQILSKCHQVHCSYRACVRRTCTVNSLFPSIFISAPLCQRNVTHRRRETGKAKLKVTAKESVWIFFLLQQQTLSGGVHY